MLEKHNLSDEKIKEIFDYHNIIYKYYENNFEIFFLNYKKAQALVDAYFMNNKNNDKMPLLLPVQFYYLLNKTGLYDTMKIVLDNIKNIDIHKYAYYCGYLYGARFYEYEKALYMYFELKQYLIELNQNLDFTIDELKEMWMESYLI